MQARKKNYNKKSGKRSKSQSYTQGTGAPRVNTKIVTCGSYNIVGAPDKMRVTLKYTDNYLFSGTPNPAAQVWRLNSLFDPDLTGTGHQPTYYDQWSSLYNQYIVTGCRVHLDVASDSSIPVMLTLAANDANSSAQGTDANSEMKFSVRKFIGPLTGDGVKSLDLKVSIPAAAGENLSQYMGDPSNYSGTGTNPADVVFGWFKCASFDSSTNLSISVLATLYFECEFRSLTAPGTS